MITGSEKLNPVKYQSKFRGFHLQINKLILRRVKQVGDISYLPRRY